MACINYDTWGVCLPEGDFPATVGNLPFQSDLRMLFPGQEGEDAVKEWQSLQTYMTPLAAASVALPPAAIRFDVGLLATLFRFRAPSRSTLRVGYEPLAHRYSSS